MPARNLDRIARSLLGQTTDARQLLDQARSSAEGSDPDLSLREHIDQQPGRFEWYRHCAVLADVLQRVADGELKRVMVFMPPRHGKTELVSRRFPGYVLSRFPSHWVGLASYSAELAHGFSRRARDLYRSGGGELHADASAVREWETPVGGGMWASGVGGPLTGRGFHVGIIDDPVKNSEEAASEVYREGLREWYATVFRTRAEPGAAIVLVCTRWHEDDLAGWLLSREDAAREGWHVVNMEALREEDPAEFPENCTVEEDWREIGDALCPERYDIDALESIASAVGPRAWASLYQQRPRPREGNLFRYSWFEFVDQVPRDSALVRYWDTAGSEGRGDYTAGVLMARDTRGVFYVRDVVRGQWAPGKRDAMIYQTAVEDRKRFGQEREPTIWLEEEAGVAGVERTDATRRHLAGFTTRSERPTGSKEVRADPFAAQAEIGNVKIERGEWNTAFLDELTAFPYGRHDDQVDAASGAFAKLAAYRGKAEVFGFRLY